MTANLAEWLLTQIAADEAVAREPWSHVLSDVKAWWDEGEDEAGFFADDQPDDVKGLAKTLFQIERARGRYVHVLAVCKAHRRIVEAHPIDAAPVERHPKWTDEQNARFRAQYGYRDDQELAYGCETCDAFDDGLVFHGASEGCPTLRALAAIYADRDGFRSEWR